MSEPNQPEVFEQNTSRIRRQVVYVPPEPKAVDQFALEVCQQLAEHGNPGCSDPEVVSGLAAFLNFAGEVLAKHLNQRTNLKEGM